MALAPIPLDTLTWDQIVTAIQTRIVPDSQNKWTLHAPTHSRGRRARRAGSGIASRCRERVLAPSPQTVAERVDSTACGVSCGMG
jgi:hypothetical protein